MYSHNLQDVGNLQYTCTSRQTINKISSYQPTLPSSQPAASIESSGLASMHQTAPPAASREADGFKRIRSHSWMVPENKTTKSKVESFSQITSDASSPPGTLNYILMVVLPVSPAEKSLPSHQTRASMEKSALPGTQSSLKKLSPS